MAPNNPTTKNPTPPTANPCHLYGIPNCDSVKKARKWLTATGIDYQFIDFRKDGIDRRQLADWIKHAGLEKVLNRRGTTWRKLSESQRALQSTEQALDLLCAKPTLIKRPVLIRGDQLQIGFNAEDYTRIFK
ncbi:MAG: ArsC family reductase [Cellvibrionales bacterium]|nr:ArsC family reductase [Cellvibrionales bacterium]